MENSIFVLVDVDVLCGTSFWDHVHNYDAFLCYYLDSCLIIPNSQHTPEKVFQR